MFRVSTVPVFSFWSLPLTVSLAPGGLPITIDTGFFSFQVLVWPASTVSWESCWPVGLSNPTQQLETAVSMITAVSAGTALCVAGLDVVGAGVGLASGRTVDAAVADEWLVFVETRW